MDHVWLKLSCSLKRKDLKGSAYSHPITTNTMSWIEDELTVDQPVDALETSLTVDTDIPMKTNTVYSIDVASQPAASQPAASQAIMQAGRQEAAASQPILCGVKLEVKCEVKCSEVRCTEVE